MLTNQDEQYLHKCKDLVIKINNRTDNPETIQTCLFLMSLGSALGYTGVEDKEELVEEVAGPMLEEKGFKETCKHVIDIISNG